MLLPAQWPTFAAGLGGSLGIIGEVAAALPPVILVLRPGRSLLAVLPGLISALLLVSIATRRLATRRTPRPTRRA